MTKSFPHLLHAPVTEGVIDFQIEAANSIDIDALEAAAERLQPQYLRKSQIIEVAASLILSAEGRSTDTKARAMGVRFESTDGKYVALFRVNGFSLSRLAPYETWEKLVAEARRLWNIYLGCASPERVVRAATRFINNLRLPLRDGDDLELYLTNPPQVPANLPQGMTAFLQRVVINVPELEGQANIIQMLQEGTAAPIDKIPVILDIDVYRIATFDPNGEEIWRYLEKLRDFKNKVFFESVTKRALDLYR